jgi:hypothetical protein
MPTSKPPTASLGHTSPASTTKTTPISNTEALRAALSQMQETGTYDFYSVLEVLSLTTDVMSPSASSTTSASQKNFSMSQKNCRFCC